MHQSKSTPSIKTKLSRCLMLQITRSDPRIFKLRLVFDVSISRPQSNNWCLESRMLLLLLLLCLSIKPALFFQDVVSSQNAKMKDGGAVALTEVIPELSTAKSIYPCLDTFDIVLSRSEQSDRLTRRPVSGETIEKRHLVRVYWASRAVVERIARITRHHRANTNTNSQTPSKHSFRHFQAKRFSKLIELRELNYVREYGVTPGSPLVKLRCDVFDPIEDAFYCFVYLILYRSIVLYEDLPHCVPITAPTATDGDSGHSVPLEQWGRINFPQFTSDAPLSFTSNQTSLEQIRSLLIPPGPVYETINRKQFERALIDSSGEDGLGEENVRQYALTSAFQSEHQSDTRLSKPIRKVTVQSHSCRCVDQTHSPSHDLHHELLQLNLSHSETTIVHIIITPCSTYDDSPLPYDLKIDENFLDTTTLGYNTSIRTKVHFKKKRRKHKKLKRSQYSQKENISRSSVSERNETTWQTGQSNSMWPERTTCVLAIDPPGDYTMRLESIDPSMAWPSELLTPLGQQAFLPIDLIDYLDKYPILIIRKGQLAIDPQMNIENRSRTYFLHSQHLRFEASASMNVTLRFKRSFQSVSDWHARSNQSEQALSQKLISLVKRTVSTIALKMIDLSEAENRERSALGAIPLFHLTSILLSVFIVLTLLIYIVIAVTGACKSARKKQVKIVSEAQVVLDSHCQVRTVIAITEPTRRDQPEPLEMSPNQSTSLAKFDAQSLELDYYDYAQPLMLHSGSCLPKSASGGQCLGGGSVALGHSSRFSTLPVPVRDGEASGQCWPVAHSPPKCPLINGHSALEHPRSDTSAQATIHSSSVPRTTFTKPPILLSTFTRNQ